MIIQYKFPLLSFRIEEVLTEGRIGGQIAGAAGTDGDVDAGVVVVIGRTGAYDGGDVATTVNHGVPSENL